MTKTFSHPLSFFTWPQFNQEVDCHNNINWWQLAISITNLDRYLLLVYLPAYLPTYKYKCHDFYWPSLLATTWLEKEFSTFIIFFSSFFLLSTFFSIHVDRQPANFTLTLTRICRHTTKSIEEWMISWKLINFMSWSNFFLHHFVSSRLVLPWLNFTFTNMWITTTGLSWLPPRTALKVVNKQIQ